MNNSKIEIKAKPNYFVKSRVWWDPEWTVPVMAVLLSGMLALTLALWTQTLGEHDRMAAAVAAGVSKAVEDFDTTKQDLQNARKLLVGKDSLIEMQTRLVQAQSGYNRELLDRNGVLESADQSMAALNRDECKRRFAVSMEVEQSKDEAQVNRRETRVIGKAATAANWAVNHAQQVAPVQLNGYGSSRHEEMLMVPGSAFPSPLSDVGGDQSRPIR